MALTELKEALWQTMGLLWRGNDPANPFGLPSDLPSHLKMAAVKKAYYDRRGLYGSIPNGPKGHRNPARRAVEFHSNHLFAGDLPDALPIETKNQAIVEPIHQIWTWSNFSIKKQVFARHMALYGDGFIRVAGTKEKQRVWLELIDARFVTSFESDERGFINTFRTDKPRPKDSTYPRPYVLTEVWSKERGDYRIFKHEKGIGEDLAKLQGYLTSRIQLPIDFVPIVHAPFMDDGDETRGGRGVGVFEPYLDDIDEACRVGSRRNEMYFRYDRNTWALVHDNKDPEGNPMPAGRYQISAEGIGVGSLGENASEPEPDTVELGNDKIIRLFGGGRLESLVPNVDWSAAKQADDDMMNWLAEEMPELLYSELKEKGELSGVALRRIMGAAIDRAVEARGSGERAIVRANQMALTYAQKLQLPGFEADTIGTYDNKDFDHKFKVRPILPESEAEQAATDLARAQADEVMARVRQTSQGPLQTEQQAPGTEGPGGQDAVQRIVSQLELESTNGRSGTT